MGVLIFTGQKGAPGRDRTCDHRIRSPLLFPLSYGRPAARRGRRTSLLRLSAPVSPVTALTRRNAGALCGRAARVELLEGHARSGDVPAAKVRARR